MKDFKEVVEQIIEDAGLGNVGGKTRARLVAAIGNAVHGIVDEPVQELRNTIEEARKAENELHSKYENLLKELIDTKQKITEAGNRILCQKTERLAKVYKLMQECIEDQTIEILHEDIFEVSENRLFFMKYRCTCGEEWVADHDCACNDKCPACNKEIEPYEVEEVR